MAECAAEFCKCSKWAFTVNQINYILLMNFKAIMYEAEEGGYWAEVPALPGCVTQGETKAELEINLREAIAAWLMAGESDYEPSSDEQILEVAV